MMRGVVFPQELAEVVELRGPGSETQRGTVTVVTWWAIFFPTPDLTTAGPKSCKEGMARKGLLW